MDLSSLLSRRKRQASIVTLLCGTLAAPALSAPASHIPAITEQSVQTGSIAPKQKLTLNFVLPFRNKTALDKFVQDVSTPGSPSYGKYLSAAEFHARFSPSQADYDAVVAYARASGFTVTNTLSSRKLVQVTAPATLVQSELGINLLTYTAPGGRAFFAPDRQPTFPATVAAKVTGISGLSNAATQMPHIRRNTSKTPEKIVAGQMHPRLLSSSVKAHTVGSAMNGGLTPQDIETAYGLKKYPPAVATDTTGYGAGQTLGLFELDTYLPSDILLYEQRYNLPQLMPTNQIDPTNPVTPTGGNDEVTLDIEVQLAVAPLAKAILVYSGGNVSSLVVQQYQKIADDDLATAISTSWGAPEVTNDSVSLDGESDAFEQMAAQGQSIYAAAGDNGAYDGGGTSATVNMTDATALLVDDPASQPFMCGVGGTTLSVVTPGTNLTYKSEASWGTPDTGTGGGGGGGVSRIWSMPTYQKGAVHTGDIPSGYGTAGVDANYPTNPDPYKFRSVPDVSFNANPDTGYDIVFDGAAGSATIIGGTSAAAPIWAGFTALVNEARASNGLPLFGFPNTPIYQAGIAGDYDTIGHDVEDNSTNLYFPAVEAYDESTGWGSFKSSTLSYFGRPFATHFVAQPGNTYDFLTWTASAGSVRYDIFRSVAGGAATQIGSATGTSYMDSHLTNDKAYTYFLRTVYKHGSSLNSASSTATPTGVVITSGPTVTTSAGAATIAWKTNVLSDTVVKYGKSGAVLSSTKKGSTRVRSHSVTLTGLAATTTYSYTVSSNDGIITATSSVHVFTTP